MLYSIAAINSKITDINRVICVDWSALRHALGGVIADRVQPLLYFYTSCELPLLYSLFLRQ